MNYCKMQSPVGDIFIFEENGKITQISTRYTPNGECSEFLSDVLAQSVTQLTEYFAGKRKIFTLPFELKGTQFQKQVWKALTEIPYGQTRSYKDIAEAIGNSKAVRAVGGANHNNPIMIMVPCHRVIGSNGSLTGYAGGMDMKKILLDLETVHN